MKPTADFELPPERAKDLRQAKQLSWATLAYLATVIPLMGWVMGSSQAMRTAWIEDLLSLVPPIGFLVAARIRFRPHSEHYPYGFHRATNIAFLLAALALLVMGGYLLGDAVGKLIIAEHPTIGSVTLLGHTFWQGWLMLPVLVYATIPAFILGRLKLPVANQLHDKPLYADAAMNKADWMTGVAAAVGVLGIGYGWWWADAVAAGVIALSVFNDGVQNLRAVIGDLMDRAPQSVDHSKYLDLPERLKMALQELPWVQHADVRLREHGHVLYGEAFLVMRDGGRVGGRVGGRDGVDVTERAEQALATAYDLDWRLHELVVQFLPEAETDRASEGDG